MAIDMVGPSPARDVGVCTGCNFPGYTTDDGKIKPGKVWKVTFGLIVLRLCRRCLWDFRQKMKEHKL